MILRFLFFLIIAYLAYKFIFDFLLPVYRTTKRMKAGFKQIKERMQQEMNNSRFAQTQKTTETEEEKKGDYIDFE